MADPSGMLNGNDSLLYTVDSNGALVMLGGVTSSSTTITNNLVETTNKSSEESRTYLDEAGTQSISHTEEVFFSSDTAYRTILDRYDDQTAHQYFFFYAGIDDLDQPADMFELIIPSATNSFEIDVPVSASITFESSGNFVLAQQYFTAIDSNGDDAVDSNGNIAIARA